MVSLKDAELLSLGVTSPADRQTILDSIANINSLNDASTSDATSFSVRDTRDPKVSVAVLGRLSLATLTLGQLMRSLLALVSELFGSSASGSRHRVVVDKVERVRNEPLSVSFKRHLKALGSPDVVQRLFLPPVIDPIAAPRGGGLPPVKEEHILADGLVKCVAAGPFGTGLYFPSSFTVLRPSATFRMIVCDVALGRNFIRDEHAPVSSLQDGQYDSISFPPGLVSKTHPSAKEDLGVKSHLQAVPRYVVSFTLHSSAASRNILVVSSDGSGDHRAINDALEAAEAGDLILLRPGTYSEAIVMKKDVHVMASLAGGSIIDQPITIACNGQLTGVTVRASDGSSVAVTITGGSPTLTGCDVTGMVAVGSAAQLVLRECHIHDSAAHGVHVAEQSTCLVEKCNVQLTELCGVQVDGGARGVIMNSTVAYCKQNGIYLLDGAKGVIEGCNIFGCSFPGIAVNAADPVIARNRIHHNERSGLVIAGKSEDNTLVEDNNVFANGRDGIVIAKDAVCLLQGNSIFDNKGAGVQIMTGASPQLVKTHIFNNKESGVLVGRGGNAHVSDCQIFANSKSGITVTKGGTSVVVDGCDVFSNAPIGVEILQQAAPKILHNRIFQQATNVAVEKKAIPTIQSNEIFAGKTCGLLLQAACEPIVTANTVHTNAVAVQGATPAYLADLKTTNKM